MPAIGRSGTGPGSKFGTEWIIDALRGALRTSVSPLDYGDINGNLLGFYRCSVATGTTVSIGAAGILNYLRWSDTSRVMALIRVQLGSYIAATITTAVAVDVGLVMSRGSTAAGSGGSAVTMGGNNQKLRGVMGTSLVTDFRVATTGALTRPTGGTADANPISLTPMKSAWNIQNPGTATFNNTSTDTLFDLYKWDPTEHPVVMVNGDTAEIQEFTAGPATGGIRWYITWTWAELALF